MKTSPHLILVLSALLLSNCESKVIRRNSIAVQGTKLRKTAAYKAQILQVGDKVSTGTNSFNSYDFIQTQGQLPVTVTTSMKVNEVSAWLSEIGLNGIPEVSEAGGSLSKKRTEQGTFVVVAIQNRKSLIDLLQAPQNRAMVDWLSKRSKPRIITAVATTLGQKTTSADEATGTVTANLSTVGAGPGSTTLKLTRSGSSTVEFSDGTVFAYEMSIPVWRRDADGRLYIADYVEDRASAWGNPTPPPGTYMDAARVP